MCKEELHEKSLLLPIIDIHCSDLSIVINIHTISLKEAIVFGFSYVGEVSRAVAAGVSRALGGNLLKVMLIDPDIGRPVTVLSLVENARYAF